MNSLSESEKFNPINSGHIALLVCEIITLFYPILIGEIELALAALDIDLKPSTINRHLYLLTKMKFISHEWYCNYKFYHPANKNKKTISLGRTKNNNPTEPQRIRIRALSTFTTNKSSQPRKRKAALEQIQTKLSDTPA